mmetsp:Transcript_21201/g.21319  ORF Transcript_21201/g.21319 Transcript_21201/m.21319 type:complete len:127 (-) Transcript_21201:133-513(-)
MSVQDDERGERDREKGGRAVRMNISGASLVQLMKLQHQNKREIERERGKGSMQTESLNSEIMRDRSIENKREIGTVFEREKEKCMQRVSVGQLFASAATRSEAENSLEKEREREKPVSLQELERMR